MLGSLGMNQDAKLDAIEPIPAPVDVTTCALCGTEIARDAAYLVNLKTSCQDCVAKVRAEVAAQVPSGTNVVVAALGGFAGALAGAAVWAGIAIATDLEVGYVAVLVGYLTGLGVKLGAGKQRGPMLQYLAAAISVVGLVAAKYMLFAYVMVKIARENGVDVGYFDGIIRDNFPQALGQMVGAFDVLFLVLALGAAYRVPKAHAVSIAKA
jgi:hypothetical protein